MSSARLAKRYVRNLIHNCLEFKGIFHVMSVLSRKMRGGVGALKVILGFAAALCMGLVAGAQAAQQPELIPMWKASDESNTATIDHSQWQEILDAYLVADHPTGINRFDYAGLKASAEDAAKLRGYLTGLAKLDPRGYSLAEQKAYWINVYNALTVFVIVPRFPVESIKDIKSGIIDFGPWNLELLPVAGVPLTLNQIEHGILRPIWADPRIHYAVNCASLGCPNLSPEVYRADNLERLLDQAARDYINHPRGVQVVDGDLLVSSIYEWFKVDFGDNDEGVFAHLERYANESTVALLEGHESFDHDYDWGINAP